MQQITDKFRWGSSRSVRAHKRVKCKLEDSIVWKNNEILKIIEKLKETNEDTFFVGPGKVAEIVLQMIPSILDIPCAQSIHFVRSRVDEKHLPILKQSLSQIKKNFGISFERVGSRNKRVHPPHEPKLLNAALEGLSMNAEKLSSISIRECAFSSSAVATISKLFLRSTNLISISLRGLEIKDTMMRTFCFSISYIKYHTLNLHKTTIRSETIASSRLFMMMCSAIMWRAKGKKDFTVSMPTMSEDDNGAGAIRLSQMIQRTLSLKQLNLSTAVSSFPALKQILSGIERNRSVANVSAELLNEVEQQLDHYYNEFYRESICQSDWKTRATFNVIKIES